MVLFILSLILISVSSFFVASSIEKNDVAKGFIYTVILAFAQIVLTTEILSIFTLFKIVPFLCINVLFCTISGLVWNKFDRPLWKFNFKENFYRIKNALILDKSLIILVIAWIIFILVSVFLCSVSTVTNADAKTYHVTRSAFWVLHSSINHFETANIRTIIFPINSEIVYAWIILFTKNVMFLGFLSFAFYCVYITSLYKLVHNLLGFSLRKTLWSIFIISSFAGSVIFSSSTETDLIIGALAFCTIYLFWDGLKSNKLSPVYMASLCLALALGTKSPSYFSTPAIILMFCYLVNKHKNYAKLLQFLEFCALNFLVFSSYNYILNFIDFGNIFGSAGAIVSHKNLYGIKGFFANIIKHIFLLFDFTGLNNNNILSTKILEAKSLLLNVFGLSQIPDGIFTYNNNVVNNKLAEPLAGCGILGFILLIPSLIISVIKPIFKRNRKNICLALFAFVFIVSVLTMSYTLAYMSFNVRFLNGLILISAPILVITYIKSNKNIFKLLVTFIACFYLIAISSHIWVRPLNKILPALLNKKSITEIQYTMDCLNWKTLEANYDVSCQLNAILDYNFNSPKNKIIYFASSNDTILRFVLKNIKNNNNIDFASLENIDKINLNEYNLIILPTKYQYISYIKDYTPQKINYVVKNGKNGEFVVIFDTKNSPLNCVFTDVNQKVIAKANNNLDKTPYNEYCGVPDNVFKQYKLVPVINLDRNTLYINENNLPHAKR